MNTNEYTVEFNNTLYKKIWYWGLGIEGLDILIFKTSSGNNVVRSYTKRPHWTVIENFVIEPTLVDMIKSSDKLTRNLAFEILNNKLNDRTGFNTKESDRPMVSK